MSYHCKNCCYISDHFIRIQTNTTIERQCYFCGIREGNYMYDDEHCEKMQKLASKKAKRMNEAYLGSIMSTAKLYNTLTFRNNLPDDIFIKIYLMLVNPILVRHKIFNHSDRYTR